MREIDNSLPKKLYDLLLGLFDGQGLRRWIFHGPWAGVLSELPGPGAPPALLVEGLCAELTRRGCIDEVFFDALRKERPHRSDAIDAVEAFWLGPLVRRRLCRRLVESRREAPSRPESKRHELVLKGERIGDRVCWDILVHGEARPEACVTLRGVEGALDQAKCWLRRPTPEQTLALGETLGRLLFGDTGDRGLQRALRRLFGRPAGATDLVLRPAYARVRARIVIGDPELRGLPWALASVDGHYLADDGWTFELCEVVDATVHIRLPGPCTLLVIAPRASAPELDTDLHLRELDELLSRIWPLAASRGRLAEHRLIARSEAEVAEIYRAGRKPEVVYVVGRAQINFDDPPWMILDGEFGGAPVDLDALVHTLHGAQVVFLNLLGRHLHMLAAAMLPGPASVVVPLASAEAQDAMDVGLAWLEALLRRGFSPVEALDAVVCEGAGMRAALMVTRTRYRSWRTTVAPTEDFARKVPVRLDRSAQRTRLFDKLIDFAAGSQKVLSVVAPAPDDQRPEGLGALLLLHTHERLRGCDLHLHHVPLPFPKRVSGEYLRDRLDRAIEDSVLERRDDESLEHAFARHIEVYARRRGLARGTRCILWIDWQQLGRPPDPPVTTDILETWLDFGADLAVHCPSSVKILSLMTAVASPAGCTALGEFLGRELLETSAGRKLISARSDFIVLPPAGHVALHDLIDFLTHHASCPNDLVVAGATTIFAETRGNYQATVARLASIERSGAWSSLVSTPSAHAKPFARTFK